LNDEDTFGMITFDDRHKILQPLTLWKLIDKSSLIHTINQIEIAGGTNVSQALDAANKMYENCMEGVNRMNRVLFCTDMEVFGNDGNTFISKVKQNSDEGIWMTVVGVGVDLTSNIIEKVSSTPGSNYCNVRSCDGFKVFASEEFGYTVCPIAFNINITLKIKYVQNIKRIWNS